MELLERAVETARAEQKRREAIKAADAEARRAAQKAEDARKQASEPQIAESRQRVLRGRSVLNTFTGFWRNVRSGREMFDAFPPDRVQQATRAFLRAADGLLGVWGAYRAGKAPAAFHGPEKDYLDASATLTEMHMVIEPVKKLDGKGLLDERDRLASLAAFPDQGLVAPVMGAVKNRAAQIEAYARTPEGQRKVTDEKSRRYRAKADRDAQERRQADAARRELDRQHRAQQEARRREENRRDREARRLSILASQDSEVAAILDRHGIHVRRDPAKTATDDAWHSFKAVDRWTSQRVVDLVAADVATLDRARLEARRAAEAPKPASVPQPEPEPKPAPPKPYSGPSGPGF